MVASSVYGMITDQPVKASYCGNTLPKDYLSPGARGQVNIYFSSGINDGNHRGFKLEVRLASKSYCFAIVTFYTSMTAMVSSFEN